MDELKNFVTQILKKMSSLEIYKKSRHRAWGSTPLSLSEVKNLHQYAIIMSTIAKSVRKALKKPSNHPKSLSTSSSYQLNEKSVSEVMHYIRKLLSNLRRRNVMRLSDQEVRNSCHMW